MVLGEVKGNQPWFVASLSCIIGQGIERVFMGIAVALSVYQYL
jgi:hypothetical protein